MAVLILQKQKVKIVGGAGGPTKDKSNTWANLDYKQENGFKGQVFVNGADDQTIKLFKDLDKKMGDEITLITSIELGN